MYRCYSVFVRCLLVSLILLALTKDCVESLELNKPSAEFRRHTLVRPILHHARTKRQITSTKATVGIHHPELTLTITKGDEDYVLDLRLNDHVVAGDHVVSYQKDGRTVLHKPSREELNICQYRGAVRGREGSSVAISTCHGFSGIIFDGKKLMYIEPAEDSNLDSQHYIYDHSDLKSNFKCGYEGGVTSNKSYDPELMEKYTSEQNIKKIRASRYKRETFEDTQVRGPFNANKLSRYVELVLVADNREFKVNGESLELLHHRFKDVANIINSVYAPLNIFIALVGIVVWSERDEITLEEDGDKTLTAFLHYRRDRLLRDIPNDNAHLLTQQKFKDGVVGKALKGPICTYNFSGGVATNHSDVIGLVATTIAHEMGHNFGMEHDTEADCKCPDEKCIMSPSSTSVTPTHWSSCSLRSLALSFERGMDYCLRNKPKSLYDSPTCGNGFLEPGEECDCGLIPLAACTSCCDHNTCTLRPNATCAVGECCNTETCRPKSAGTVCRTADKECDLPEFCTGTSEFCPKDVYKMDATPCSDNRAYCVRGSCRTHTDQCKLLWGSTGESSDQRCYYSMNVKGDKNGNCGYRREDTSTFFRCHPQNALCGLLQCKHLNERLEFGMESVSLLSATFINNNGSILPCRTAMIDLGLSDVDPGMVPDGAKCGDNMMCLNTKCVSVEAVIANVAKKETADCPSNCSGHGVCNSEGHCHCEPGFAPPLCALPGPGGSYDSGPATDSSLQRNFMVAMYVIFLGILPSILVILFLMYYSRQNVLHWWKKPRKTYVNIFKRPLKSPLCNQPNFTFNFAKYGEYSSSAFTKLVLFKKPQNKIIEKAHEEKIYENVDNDYESIKSVPIKRGTDWTRILSVFKRKPKETKMFQRKINKDIIVTGSTEFVKPNVTNIPKAIKKNDIVKTGLMSTTNVNISKDLTVNINKFKPDTVKDVKQKLSKENIVNAGLASTTNQKLNNLNTDRLPKSSRDNFREIQSIPKVHVNDISKRFELRKVNASHKY